MKRSCLVVQSLKNPATQSLLHITLAILSVALAILSVALAIIIIVFLGGSFGVSLPHAADAVHFGREASVHTSQDALHSFPVTNSYLYFMKRIGWRKVFKDSNWVAEKFYSAAGDFFWDLDSCLHDFLLRNRNKTVEKSQKFRLRR